MTPKPLMWFLIMIGVFAFVVQLLPGFDRDSPLLLLFAAVVLIVDRSSRKFDEREEQLLFQAYSTTFQWSIVALMIAFALNELSAWLGVLPTLTPFVNAHWLGLTFSGMCLLLGIAGSRSFKEMPNPVP